jgi:hypothetical protein
LRSLNKHKAWELLDNKDIDLKLTESPDFYTYNYKPEEYKKTNQQSHKQGKKEKKKYKRMSNKDEDDEKKDTPKLTGKKLKKEERRLRANGIFQKFKQLK